MNTSSTFAAFRQSCAGSFPSLPARGGLPSTPLMANPDFEAHTSPPSTRLIIRRIPPTLTQAKRLTPAHRAVAFEVGLVPDDDDGHVLVVFYADDLLAQFLELVEGGLGGDGEDEQESLPGLHVKFAHGG